jgi:spermidine synthase
MSFLSFFFPRNIVSSHSRYNKRIQVYERYGKKELYVSGIQQSGPYTKRLWMAGLRKLFLMRPHDITKIVVLGVGGGTLFPMLRKLYPAAAITGVDIDPEIIRLYKTYFDRGYHVRVVSGDAKDFVTTQIKKNRSFDLVIVDLYVGNNVPKFVTDRDFLASTKRMLAPRGVCMWNYFSEEHQAHNESVLLDRLSKIYQSVDSQDILRNIFFYCR